MNPTEREQKQKLEEMRRKLTLTGCRESTFITVELIFFEALALSRELEGSELHSALKKLQQDEYHHTKEFFKKSTQREKVIRSFMASFKKVLTTSIKNFQMTALAV